MAERSSTVTAAFADARHPPPSRIVFGLFLVKLGTHLAVLAALLIVGKAAGKFDLGQVTIFALIVLSAISHSSGKAYLARALAYRKQL